MQYARDIRAGMQDATFEDKPRTLVTLDVQVTITPGKYHLRCVIGEKDGEISRIGAMVCELGQVCRSELE